MPMVIESVCGHTGDCGSYACAAHMVDLENDQMMVAARMVTAVGPDPSRAAVWVDDRGVQHTETEPARQPLIVAAPGAEPPAPLPDAAAELDRLGAGLARLLSFCPSGKAPPTPPSFGAKVSRESPGEKKRD